MKTYSFIGSDKNAGKTTAFNYVYSNVYTAALQKRRDICLSSIGINGEILDNYGGEDKPQIVLRPGTWFLTGADHLHGHTGKYATHLHLGPPAYKKSYIFARSLLPFPIVLEGPNTGTEITAAKKQISSILDDDSIFLIDGSIDRQFLAKPEISDGIYFSVLFSRRREQQQKTADFLKAITLSPCSRRHRHIIDEYTDSSQRWLFLDEKERIAGKGTTLIARDPAIRELCLRQKDRKSILYLNGALTRSLASFLAPFKYLEIILNNFTLYLNIHTGNPDKKLFRPKITLYHPVRIRKIFTREESLFDPGLLPANCPIINIFRINHEN
jgi:hypothetical protein